MLLFALAGCSNGNNPAENPAASPTSPPASSTQAAEPVTISVGVPTAPPALPVLHMMEAGLLGENVTIDLNVWNSPEELLAMVQGGEHDLYAFPLTVVSTLYNLSLIHISRSAHNFQALTGTDPRRERPQPVVR